MGRVREALQGALPEAVARMRLYLPNSATHAILLKPVKSNVAEAHGQVRAEGRPAESTGAEREWWPAPDVSLDTNLPPPPPPPLPLCPSPSSSQIAALLEAEYTPEEVAAIGLTPPDQLQAALDALA